MADNTCVFITDGQVSNHSEINATWSDSGAVVIYTTYLCLHISIFKICSFPSAFDAWPNVFLTHQIGRIVSGSLAKCKHVAFHLYEYACVFLGDQIEKIYVDKRHIGMDEHLYVFGCVFSVGLNEKIVSHTPRDHRRMVSLLCAF